MSKQLSVSATASVLAMALFALVTGLGGVSSAPSGNGLMASPVTALSK
ncbi:MAG: hypothetical protein KJZ64_13290 [Sphingomonadaceae bacterium]|nr:hypothetical protein [Sphingomonadaceae bacterium]